VATKASPEDVRDLGFHWEQFGPRVEEDTGFTTYIQLILDGNVSGVKDRIGASTYDDASRADDVKLIEKYLAAAELCRRRAVIVQSSAVPDGPNGDAERRLAKEYDASVQGVIDRLKEVGGGGVATSVETSSHFPQDE